MTDKIKQLQLVHDQGEIETQFSPDNVFYIQDDDKVVYYQLPYIKISATTSGTVKVQKAIYEHVATIYHETENDYIEDYYTYTPKLNKPDRFAYTGNNSVSNQDEVVYLKHINEGTYYNENIQVYEAIKDTETGEFSVGDFISAYTISDYLIYAYDTTSVDVVYPPTKNYKIPTYDGFSFHLRGINNEDKKHITDLYVSKGIGIIPRLSCSNCIALSGITIEDGITAIIGNAFNGCTSLTDITIPESVTSIDSSSFNGCDNLKIIRYKGTATGFPWGATNATLIK